MHKQDRRGHLDRCRSRIEKALLSDPSNAYRVQSSSERFTQYFARKIEESVSSTTPPICAGQGVASDPGNRRNLDQTGSDPLPKKARLDSPQVVSEGTTRPAEGPDSSTPPKRARRTFASHTGNDAMDSLPTTPSQSSTSIPPENETLTLDSALLDLVLVDGGDSWVYL